MGWAPGTAVGVPEGCPAGPPPWPGPPAGWPPFSTLELTCTSTCRSGDTTNVAETMTVAPASTVAGHSQPCPSAARPPGARGTGCPGLKATGTRTRCAGSSRKEKEGRAQ